MLIASEAKADYVSAGLKFATFAFLSGFTHFPCVHQTCGYYRNQTAHLKRNLPHTKIRYVHKRKGENSWRGNSLIFPCGVQRGGRWMVCSEKQTGNTGLGWRGISENLPRLNMLKSNLLKHSCYQHIWSKPKDSALSQQDFRNASISGPWTTFGMIFSGLANSNVFGAR